VNANIVMAAAAITALKDAERNSVTSSIGSGWRASYQTKPTRETASTAYATRMGPAV
jgi:hypothetical protein